MTFRRFIDVGFAILVEERLRRGQDLLAALSEMGGVGEEPVEQAARIDNKQSINELMAMMGGVKGAPV